MLNNKVYDEIQDQKCKIPGICEQVQFIALDIPEFITGETTDDDYLEVIAKLSEAAKHLNMAWEALSEAISIIK